MESNQLLLDRMEDLASKAIKTGCAASRFLTPSEVTNVSVYFSCRRDVTISFNGGFNGAERMRAIFLNPDWGSFNESEMFSALKIVYRPQDTLGHRDILGALMALGIERDTLGDIIVEMDENQSASHMQTGIVSKRDFSSAALVCIPEMSEYISDNLTKAGRVGVSVSGLHLDNLPEKKENLVIKTDTVASLRLDAVLCAAFGLSRGKASEIISAGIVSLNHEPCLQPAKEVGKDTILSARGIGRAKIMQIGNVTRKGRIFIEVGLYGR